MGEFLSGFVNALPGTIALGLIWGIMAIGVYITFKILDIADLTVDGSFATGGAVLAVMLMNGAPVWAAMIVAFFAGAVAGLVTALLHIFFGIPPILAGILTQLSLYSVNITVMGQANFGLIGYISKLLIPSRNVSGVPFYNNAIFIISLFVAAIVGLLYWLFGTEFGAAMRATGCNINMSRAQGINTNVAKVVALMLSNGIVALSGALLAQYQGNSDVNMGRGSIVIGLAAVIIGEAVVGRFFRNFAIRLFSVAVGGVIYYIVYQAVSLAGLNTDFLKLFSAVVVALFLGIPFWKQQISSRRVRNAAEEKGGGSDA